MDFGGHVGAIKHFFFCPATFDIPIVKMRLCTGPKKPIRANPLLEQQHDGTKSFSKSERSLRLLESNKGLRE
jgi:hypothetical protein